jgi:hypothetical protein
MPTTTVSKRAAAKTAQSRPDPLAVSGVETAFDQVSRRGWLPEWHWFGLLVIASGPSSSRLSRYAPPTKQVQSHLS